MVPDIKHILAAVDFSDTSGNALRIAAELCKKHSATLHLLHVLENRYIATTIEPYIPAPPVHESDNAARNRLYSMYGSIINDPKLSVEVHLPVGLAFDEICAAASSIPADMIILGTHGVSGLKEVIMGTTAYSVIKHTNKPVLTIPDDYKHEAFKKILFPVRPVKDVLAKYEFIRSFLTDQDVSLHIAVLAHPDEEVPPNTFDELHEIIADCNRSQLRCTHEFYTCSNYATKVLELGNEMNADLVVINATLDYKWTEIFSGPYTRQVVNHAHIPVLSYRQDVQVPELAEEENSF